MSARHRSVVVLTCDGCGGLGIQADDVQIARLELTSGGGYSEPRKDYDLCRACTQAPHEFIALWETLACQRCGDLKENHR